MRGSHETPKFSRLGADVSDSTNTPATAGSTRASALLTLVSTASMESWEGEEDTGGLEATLLLILPPPTPTQFERVWDNVCPHPPPHPQDSIAWWDGNMLLPFIVTLDCSSFRDLNGRFGFPSVFDGILNGSSREGTCSQRQDLNWRC